MIEIQNKKLAGLFSKCFNPALISYKDNLLLYYRYTSQPLRVYTNIGFVKLDANFQPISRHQHVQIPHVSPQIVTVDDPRVFVWRDELWMIHCQSARCLPSRNWSSSIVLSKLDLEGKVLQTHIPNYGRNLNCAVTNAPPDYEKNWTPLVVDDDLYIIYEINPFVVLKFEPEHQAWTPVCNKPWKFSYPNYLSGGTPLIPWNGSEYIGLFHTYSKTADQQRLYSMSFYTVDVKEWRVTKISAQPILTAWHDPAKDVRKWEPFRKLRPLVVFPGGIVDLGDEWAVSFGWNDCRSFIERYKKSVVYQTLREIET